MSTGADALLAIRSLVIKKQMPSWSPDRSMIICGAHSYPRRTLTPYHNKVDTFFALDDLFLFLEDTAKASSTYGAYMLEAKRLKVAHVAPGTQKAELLSYLRGETHTNDNVDLPGLARYEAAQAAGARGARDAAAVADDADDERGVKRQRMHDGSSSAASASSSSSSSSAQAMDIIVRDECILSTHLSILQVPRKNFSSLLDLWRGPIESKHKSRSAAHIKPEKPAATLSPKDPNYGIPIIIVPQAASSVISLYNVYELLINGIFEPCDAMRAKSSKSPPSVLPLTRSSRHDPSKTVCYQVMDDVKLLKSDEDWSRVVGVFVNGPEWQFADWPKQRFANPAAIFENVCAFHLHFGDERLHPNLVQWRTHRLSISKTKRHGDRGVVLDFWRLLTEFIETRNASKKLTI